MFVLYGQTTSNFSSKSHFGGGNPCEAKRRSACCTASTDCYQWDAQNYYCNNRYSILLYCSSILSFLLQELQLISQVKDTLIDTLNQAKTQLVNSREAKHRLEMDWSDKVILLILDSYFESQDLLLVI